MKVEDLYVLVGMVLPEFYCILATDVDVHTATRAVGFRVIRKLLGIFPNGNKSIPQKPLLSAGKAFQELNNFVVDKESVTHRQSLEKPKRRSNSSSVAKSETGRSIFSASFLR